MTDDADVRVTGERIEALLAQVRSRGDARTAAAAEELVRSVVALYGAGLERVVAAVPDEIGRLTADPLVESLLLVHGLHPLDVTARIERAVDQVRPRLGSHVGGVELVGVDDAGVAHLRLVGTRDGCGSSTRTAGSAIRDAVEAAAPELTGVDVQAVAPPSGPCDLPMPTVRGPRTAERVGATS